MTRDYHRPVMLNECIEGLAINPEGVYVDLTFGGGGHSKAILEKIDKGHLYGFDQDVDAKANAEKIKESSFTFVEANFRFLKRYLKMYGVTQVDGILGDLGISSHQIDEESRGFSTRYDAELDMRMDQASDNTARDVVNSYSQVDLHKIFGMYGEVRNAKTLAAAIVAERVNKAINTTEDLKNILRKFAKRGKENRYYAQVFQAIRIEVNEELKVLEEVMEQCAEVLKPGGRLVVMSYHSLEDRIVKNIINKGSAEGKVEKDFYGNVIKPFKAINKKPIEAQPEEIEINNRARSAKLRIAEKI